MTDLVKPSLTGLQDLLDRWAESIQQETDTGDIARLNRALREAAPSLLAIVHAARAMLSAGMCDHVNCEEGCPSCDAWEALSLALYKVRP
jgi:hypothetical protein